MIGQRISDRYVILESIGGGGMANVYLALDVILDRHVAVKVLQPQFSDDEQFIKRFRREAQSATSLAHPNIVNIFDVGEEANLYYIVMEYVKGQTLKEVIQSDGPLQVDLALDYLKQILAAMAHAHANQIVHRDIKPHNILISEDGDAKVADFGIARAMSAATITHTNSVMGSVHYLSPEQARGGHITYRSDIYSLGIVLYEMLTGILPFSGDTAVSIAIKHLQNDMPSIKQINAAIPQSVENMIQKATMKDPAARYQSAEEMAEDAYTLLDPDRYNESPYQYKMDDSQEVTKAIPIVGHLSDSDDLEKTIAAEPTKPVTVTKEKETEQAKPLAKPPKKKKRKKWLFILIIVAVFTLVAGATAFAVLPNVFRVAEVQIPDVIDEPLEDAQQELEGLNLTVDVQEVDDDSVEPGHVASQNPRAGSTVKEGSTIRLQVSGEEEEITLQDYTGFPIEQAERLLEQLNVNVERVTRDSNEEQEGTVLSQTPESGSAIVPSTTTVYLTYAVESQIRLRNLEGDTEAEARAYFNEYSLRGRFSFEYDDSIAEGRVISQSPEPFEMLDQGSDVEIVISRGPEEDETDPDPVEDPVDEDPPVDDEEPSRIIEVSQAIEVSQEEQDAGEVFDIRIVFRDVTTDGEDEVFIEEEVTESKTYVVPLRVSTSQSGSFDLYINDELVKNSEERTYD
ncbi:Stk1 family PASTA domain-containing Ser/Thr kinase [Alkalicoccobacillus murimartini]|uniref:non-specific serine/threonine protein kinase n=1 Tax=Alkalicoccobacillus murimartini TaxID=171685 RepID=A0ABT9YF00_9BACI|nr:Stk1 family PASTA domain-containing Ser/Thr kinase [Alkalicoccobacillus murimartini]MDQ0206405.1 serine/threonine-protein kinase [Alkalicoccobacillus murimartini]